MNAAARDDYTRLKGELARRGVQLEWRTLLDPNDSTEKHDRWIRSGDTWYNVPPYSAVLSGKFSSLLEEPNPPPFEKWWDLGTQITAILDQ